MKLRRRWRAGRRAPATETGGSAVAPTLSDDLERAGGGVADVADLDACTGLVRRRRPGARVIRPIDEVRLQQRLHADRRERDGLVQDALVAADPARLARARGTRPAPAAR